MIRITKWGVAVVLLGFGLMFGASGQAMADSTCSTFDSTNGTTTFPGTYVGIVSGTCQIGNLNDPLQGNALVNAADDPSIYEFQLTSNALVTILDELGNNGTDAHVDVQLYSLASANSTSGTAIGSVLPFPDQLGVTGEYDLFSGDLTAGYYAIDTYLTVPGDPRYQVNITETPTATPEPSTILMFGVGLLGLAMFTRRRTASHGLAI